MEQFKGEQPEEISSEQRKEEEDLKSAKEIEGLKA